MSEQCVFSSASSSKYRRCTGVCGHVSCQRYCSLSLWETALIVVKKNKNKHKSFWFEMVSDKRETLKVYSRQLGFVDLGKRNVFKKKKMLNTTKYYIQVACIRVGCVSQQHAFPHLRMSSLYGVSMCLCIYEYIGMHMRVCTYVCMHVCVYKCRCIYAYFLLVPCFLFV